MGNEPKLLIAGNWKMNGFAQNLDQVEAVVNGLAQKPAANRDVLLCPPITLLAQASSLSQNSVLQIGAQNCHIAQSGAHTGDIGSDMLKDAGATYIIVGHSERRADHHETDGVVNAKAQSTLSSGITPIICVGETKTERQSGVALTVVEHQLDGSVPTLEEGQEIVIAYEPVWAIGTGLVPSVDDIKNMHAAIREWLIKKFGESGNSVRILYGGSLKPSNAKEILAIPHVNGGLIGGASLKAEDFLGIIYAG